MKVSARLAQAEARAVWNAHMLPPRYSDLLRYPVPSPQDASATRPRTRLTPPLTHAASGEKVRNRSTNRFPGAMPFEGSGRATRVRRSTPTPVTPTCYSRYDLARARAAFPFHYQAPFNESDHPRAKAGQSNGGEFVAKDDSASLGTTDRPSTSGAVTDQRGNVVGNFNIASGWVTRTTAAGGSKGDGHFVRTVASIDDVVQAIWSKTAPRTADEWNTWFNKNGITESPDAPVAPGYQVRGVQTPEDRLIPQNQLRALSGFSSAGQPRAAAAGMAGPIVVKLIEHVLKGVAMEYGGGKVIGLALTPAGKIAVRVMKKGKEVLEELSEEAAKKFRKSINESASSGSATGKYYKKWLDEGKPRSQLDIHRPFDSHPTSRTTSTGRSADDFVGTLHGKKVTLPGVKTQRITYRKVDQSVADVVRAKFDSTEGASFLRSLADDPAKILQLKKAGLTDTQISAMKKGLRPDGFQIHHKLPIDAGGSNDPSNLVLMKNDPYHKVITNHQNDLLRTLRSGGSAEYDCPIPDGFIYPP